MKKIVLNLIVFFIATFFLTGQSITVTSPNGGESLGLGSNHNITWNASGHK